MCCTRRRLEAETGCKENYNHVYGSQKSNFISFSRPPVNLYLVRISPQIMHTIIYLQDQIHPYSFWLW